MSELEDTLSSKGFDRKPLQDELLEVRKFYWIRPVGWKNEAVTMWIKRQSPDALNLSLGVFLPLEESEQVGTNPPMGSMLDGKAIQGVLGSSKFYLLPNLFGVLLPSRAPILARRIGRDVLRALPWFEGYETPKDCLLKLRAGETNCGFSRGPAVQALEAYLRRCDKEVG